MRYLRGNRQGDHGGPLANSCDARTLGQARVSEHLADCVRIVEADHPSHICEHLNERVGAALLGFGAVVVLVDMRCCAERYEAPVAFGW